MGFNTDITDPVLMRQLVSDDVSSLAGGASRTIELDPADFDGFDVLLVELLVPGFLYTACRIGVEPALGAVDSSLQVIQHAFGVDRTAGQMAAIRPLGGPVTLTLTNCSAFTGDSGVNVWALRGVPIGDLRSTICPRPQTRPTGVGAGATVTLVTITSNHLVADRLRATVWLDQTSDVMVQWVMLNAGFGTPTHYTVDEVIATAVRANELTTIDVPWRSNAEAYIRATNTSGAVANARVTHQVVPRD